MKIRGHTSIIRQLQVLELAIRHHRLGREVRGRFANLCFTGWHVWLYWKEEQSGFVTTLRCNLLWKVQSRSCRSSNARWQKEKNLCIEYIRMSSENQWQSFSDHEIKLCMTSESRFCHFLNVATFVPGFNYNSKPSQLYSFRYKLNNNKINEVVFITGWTQY